MPDDRHDYVAVQSHGGPLAARNLPLLGDMPAVRYTPSMQQNVSMWRRMSAPSVWAGLLAVAVSVVLVGCSVTAVQPDAKGSLDPLQRATQALFQTPADGASWEVFRLPGKRFAPFEPVAAVDRVALRVQAARSVSVLRQRFDQPLLSAGTLAFSWRVDGLPEGADLKDAGSTDAPVRILLAFDGDRSRWSPRAHRMSELSQLLTGEPLPYATLSYVWSRDDALESVLHNPRTDRIRKLVVESGVQNLGQWREYRRDVRADFLRAFGEEPGPLLAVALMTDTDNTASSLQAWYGPLRLEAGVPR